MTDSFVFMQLKPILASNKHSSLSLLKNYDVLMVQSTNCIIILVPSPCLPKPPFLTVLISCKHSCRFSPLRNTGYPMRKLIIHFGNRPPIKRQGKLPLTQHNITAAIQNATFKANQLRRSVICPSPVTNPSTPTFLHPSKCRSP